VTYNIKANSKIKGIGFLLLALLIFSLQNIAVKWIGGDYSIMEMVSIRSIIAIPSALLLFRLEGNRGLPVTKSHKLEFLRGFLLFLSYTFHFMALAALPLAAVESVRVSAPLLITLFSILILREKVQLRRWLALIIGLAGVLFIIKPGSSTFNIGSLFMVFSVMFYSLSVILTRRLQTIDSSATMAFYSSLVYLIASIVFGTLILVIGEIPNAHAGIAFLFRSWSMPSLLDGLIMAGLGLVWAGGMYSMTRAYSLARASLVAPFEYMSLPINVLWGWIFWQEIPTLLTIVGSAITLLCGLYVVSLERK